MLGHQDIFKVEFGVLTRRCGPVSSATHIFSLGFSLQFVKSWAFWNFPNAERGIDRESYCSYGFDRVMVGGPLLSQCWMATTISNSYIKAKLYWLDSQTKWSGSQSEPQLEPPPPPLSFCPPGMHTFTFWNVSGMLCFKLQLSELWTVNTFCSNILNNNKVHLYKKVYYITI